MRLSMLAGGRARPGPEQALFEEYLGRLPFPVPLREVVGRDGAEERQKLAAMIPSGHRLVMLDERGRDLASRALAERLAAWRDAGDPVCFVIGGADGLDDALRARADLLLSFGKATWPHLLARVLLAEQLFRASSILSGHPYHRD